MYWRVVREKFWRGTLRSIPNGGTLVRALFVRRLTYEDHDCDLVHPIMVRGYILTAMDSFIAVMDAHGSNSYCYANLKCV